MTVAWFQGRAGGCSKTHTRASVASAILSATSAGSRTGPAVSPARDRRSAGLLQELLDEREPDALRAVVPLLQVAHLDRCRRHAVEEPEDLGDVEIAVGPRALLRYLLLMCSKQRGVHESQPRPR